VRTVVCNTGPLLHLGEVGLLGLLAKAGVVFIPEAVNSELGRIHPSWINDRPPWITVEKLSADEASKVDELCRTGWLDRGEGEAAILAQTLKADWFLTDDGAARVLGDVLGLEVHGSLGVVLWGAATELLKHNEAREALERLSRSSLWISRRILEKANRALDEIFGQGDAR
jgi:predicted nucleic acid-binding protein